MSENVNIPMKPLSELVIINNGIDYKKNPKGEAEIPIYGTGGIMGYTSIALNEGPAVLSGRKGSINRPFYVEGKFWNVDTIFCLKPIDENHAKWLYYSLLNVDMMKLNEATGVPSITSKSLYRLKINYFKPEKQREIANILTKCDTVIEQTQATIAKYKAIKQGMLHDLFTRGLDCNGKLRPTYLQAPELYKESELGMIPKEWEVKESHKVVRFINGRAYSIHEWETTGTPVIRLQNLTGSGDTYYYSNLNLPEDQYCVKGDLLYMWSASFGPYIWNDDKAIYHYHIWKVECSNKMSQEYFYYDLLRFTETVLNGANGSTMAHITKNRMDKRPICTPHIDEQEIITEKLIAIENQLQAEETLLSKYQSIKRGLMSDLLSGKKPLTPPVKNGINCRE